MSDTGLVIDDFFFFFNDTATTEIYTLSLHDALPICHDLVTQADAEDGLAGLHQFLGGGNGDRKSTRLNSSHGYISYAVFCLKKKKKANRTNDHFLAMPSPALRTYLTTVISALHSPVT